MKSTKYLAMSSLTVGFLISCSNGSGGSNDKVTDTSTNLSYEYSESINGLKCTTEKKTFSNLNDYCSALINEKLNNYCATQIRRSAYKQNCAQTLTNDSSAQTSETEETAPPIESEKIVTKQDVQTAQKEPATPKVLKIMAHPTQPLKQTIQHSEDSVSSVLSGELSIDSISDSSVKRLLLSSADSVDLIVNGILDTTCKTKIDKQFENMSGDKVKFVLLAVEDESPNLECTKLMKVIETVGCQIEFKNVPTSMIADGIIETVQLTITHQ